MKTWKISLLASHMRHLAGTSKMKLYVLKRCVKITSMVITKRPTCQLPWLTGKGEIQEMMKQITIDRCRHLPLNDYRLLIFVYIRILA